MKKLAGQLKVLETKTILHSTSQRVAFSFGGYVNMTFLFCYSVYRTKQKVTMKSFLWLCVVGTAEDHTLLIHSCLSIYFQLLHIFVH